MASYLIGPYSGNVEAGLAARMMGLGPSAVMGGVLCAVGSIVITCALPELRKYRANAWPIQGIGSPRSARQDEREGIRWTGGEPSPRVCLDALAL